MTFPIGRTSLTINMQKMSRTTPNNPSPTASIYTGADKRIEDVIFKNKCSVDNILFDIEARKIKTIVYAVSEKSTKYLGDLGDM
jgi:hypothetical protein